MSIKVQTTSGGRSCSESEVFPVTGVVHPGLLCRADADLAAIWLCPSSHAVVEHTDDRGHSRRDPEPGEHLSQKREIYGIVGSLQVDEAHGNLVVRGSPVPTPVVGVLPTSWLRSIVGAGIPTEVTEPVGYDIPEEFSSMCLD